MSKKIFNSSIVAILAIGFLVGNYIWKDLSSRPNFASQKVQKGNIEEALNIRGTVKPNISADLGFESGGRITALTHKVGDKVNQGEILATANSADLKALIVQAVAERNSAQAILDENKNLKKKQILILKPD